MLLTGREEGFTLLEVLITVVIIALAVGVVMPSFNGLIESIKLKTEQRKISNLFKEARGRAVINGSTQLVIVKENQLIYKITDDETYTLTLEKMELLNSTKEHISFLDNGTSSGGKLIFGLNNRLKYELSIEPVTGKVYWREVHGE